MEIQVYGQLRSVTGGKMVTLSPAEHTVRGVVTALRESYPKIDAHLIDCEGALRPSVRVVVNGEKATMDTDCPADADVKLFPAMQGG
ncbi:MoaD/ThiS family protein [Halosegnis rubeus]|jgi:molybdopterin converting factor small subunit|uniref:MoaD/ThiS family protein n=1 Tax=Halosegnis rubeus TaxID=2212850 RepID=A0A5N5U799_9EURY|nr:ubiquitin-like small modifier protein 1 [Halosegnis rubeus]KAB7513957.1 MoaD/ThiS family protein [Halosegnis rubeus]KAB7514358.1 MoaD/ThiS family protein [Halosegnis rubeus]KAB7518730.1 MoaD/ThiS family protein [Halosegnis rubeus]